MDKYGYNDPVYVADAVFVETTMVHDHVEQQVNEAGARAFLTQHKWPVGLQDTFLENLKNMPIRYFICDDSGSMVAADGHRLVGNDATAK